MEAQLPRLPDGEDAAAGVGVQPSLRRLRGGVEGALRAHAGVDVLDGHPREPVELPRREYRHHGARGVDTLDTAGGEHDPDGCAGRRAGFLHLKGRADQRRAAEDVGRSAGHADPAVTDLELAPGS